MKKNKIPQVCDYYFILHVSFFAVKDQIKGGRRNNHEDNEQRMLIFSLALLQPPLQEVLNIQLTAIKSALSASQLFCIYAFFGCKIVTYIYTLKCLMAAFQFSITSDL